MKRRVALGAVGPGGEAPRWAAPCSVKPRPDARPGQDRRRGRTRGGSLSLSPAAQRGSRAVGWAPRGPAHSHHRAAQVVRRRRVPRARAAVRRGAALRPPRAPRGGAVATRWPHFGVHGRGRASQRADPRARGRRKSEGAAARCTAAPFESLGARDGPRTGEPPLGNGHGQQEVTPTCVSCAARTTQRAAIGGNGDGGRHQTAPGRTQAGDPHPTPPRARGCAQNPSAPKLCRWAIRPAPGLRGVELRPSLLRPGQELPANRCSGRCNPGGVGRRRRGTRRRRSGAAPARAGPRTP